MTRCALVTFDIYSALFDIAGSLRGKLGEISALAGADAAAAFQLWRAKQMERAAISNSLHLGRTRFREATRQALGFSSEDAGAYKPHPDVYALPQRTLDIPRDAILHVAGGANDALGAVAAGLPCYWSNRHHDVVLDPAFAPQYDRPDLGGLLDVLP